MSYASNATSAYLDAKNEFDSAWRNPKYTQFELPPVEVNKILEERYSLVSPVSLTRTLVWDMEVRKAWDPFTFIPYVVSEGTSWGRHQLAYGCERFSRSSIQAGWITSERGRVLEDVYLNHSSQQVLFLGRTSMEGVDGTITADAYQPIFHVEHAAGGSEDDPLNLWKIVLLTEGKDERYTEPFKDMIRKGLLPGFLEIYIEQTFNIKLKRK
jgi:hypothetical protein